MKIEFFLSLILSPSAACLPLPICPHYLINTPENNILSGNLGFVTFTIIHTQFFPEVSLCVSCPIHDYSDTVSLTSVFSYIDKYPHSWFMKYVSLVMVILFRHNMSLGMYLSLCLELSTLHFFGHVPFVISVVTHTHTHILLLSEFISHHIDRCQHKMFS